MQIPVEIVWLMVGLAVGVPAFTYMVDKSKMIFDFSMIFIGAFWSFIWLNMFYIDLGSQTSGTNSTLVVNTTVTTTFTQERLYSLCQVDPCQDIQQSWNFEKFFIVLVGLVWVLLGALSFRKDRSGSAL